MTFLIFAIILALLVINVMWTWHAKGNLFSNDFSRGPVFSTISGLLSEQIIGDLDKDLLSGQKTMSIGQRKSHVFKILKSIYEKRREMEKRRKYLTLFQSVLMSAVILRIYNIHIPIRFAGINLDPQALEPSAQRAFLIIVALLTPLTAKLAFFEFLFARLFNSILRNNFIGPRDLLGASLMISGHSMLWGAVHAAKGRQNLKK